MQGRGAGPAALEPRSPVLSENGCAGEEEGAEISAGLKFICILLCSSLLAGLGLEHPFPRSRGKSLLPEHLRQARQALGGQIGDYSSTSRWLGWILRIFLSAGFAGRSCSAPS